MMLNRKRGILAISMAIGASAIVVIVVSESMLEAPELYDDSFCLLDHQDRNCSFKTLSQCMASMPGTDSECIREILNEKLVREKH